MNQDKGIKQNKISVGIVLVNYNGYKLTIDCLESLKRAEGSKKIYVVDNASTDDSVYHLKKYIDKEACEEIVLIESDINSGFAGGNNLAIRQAVEEGMDYIILLNNDTVVKQDFIKFLLEPFEQYQDCYATVSKIYYETNRNMIWYAGGDFSYRTGRVVHFRYGEQEDGRQEKIQKVTFATGCCLCLSKACVQEIGLLCEEYFLYDEDTDYCLRIEKSNHGIYYTPDSVIYHKVNASTNKKKGLIDYYMTRNRLIIIKKFVNKGRWRAAFFSELMFLYRCLKRQMNLKYVIKGSIDGFKKRTR